ncbi:MAG: hypothetical protein IT168_09165 [Bryobacterales bacterium]|nr:hypothetical protein [Bryobacterales bacterium]
MLRLCLSLLFLIPVWATDPVIFGRTYGHIPIPAYDKGHLLFLTEQKAFEVWRPNGYERFLATVDNLHGAGAMSAAVDSKGRLAVSFAYLGPNGFGAGIAYFDNTGRQTALIDTGKYLPAHVTYDHTGALWTFGWMRGDSGDGREAEEYMLFRKYVDGKETGRYISRSLFPKGLAPGAGQHGGWRLRAAADRIGAFAFVGQSSATQRWIEINLDGQLLGQYSTDDDFGGGTAFTGDAQLYRRIYAKPTKASHLQRLDHTSGTWQTVDTQAHDAILLGAEGKQLVYGEAQGPIRLQWIDQPSSGPLHQVK